MLQPNHKFCVSEQNHSFVIVFKSVSSSNHAFQEYEYWYEYGPYALPSEIMSFCSYRASSVN